MDRRFLSGAVCLVSLAVAAAVAAGPRAPDSSRKIDWQHDLHTAHRLAVETDRPLLVVFGASWCTWCKRLEQETLAHPWLTDHINRSFVPLHLDYDRDRRVAEILEVESLPCTVVLSPEADLLGRLAGYAEPPAYYGALHQAVSLRLRLRQAGDAVAKPPATKSPLEKAAASR